jgi:hypothetical protein
VATLANAAAWLGSMGVGASGVVAFGLPMDAAAGALLGVAALIGVATAAFGGRRLAPALALAWGLAWIAAGRQDGGIESAAIAWAAGLAAAVVLLAALALRIGAAPRGPGNRGSAHRRTATEAAR